MAPLDQVAVPAQDRVRAYQQEVAQLVLWELVEQCGGHHVIGGGERGLAGPALQNEELVPQRQDLDVLVRSLIGSRRRSAKVFAAARQAMRSSTADHDAVSPPST
jgi:hypothetical protein